MGFRTHVLGDKIHPADKNFTFSEAFFSFTRIGEGVFSPGFLNCTNGTKSRNAPHILFDVFTATEVYLHRAKVNLRKKKNFECYKNLDPETLLAKDIWASIDEMFHINSFKEVMLKCATRDNGILTKVDCVFTVCFITTFVSTS